MTLPASGSISMAQVAAELGISAVGLSLNDSRVRNLAGVGASGPISMSSLLGKSAYTPMTIGVTSASGYADTSAGGAGFVSATASVVVTNGDPGYTYSWQILSQSGGITIFSGTTASSITLRHSYGGHSNGLASATLQCTVTDSTGHQAARNVGATLEWEWANA